MVMGILILSNTFSTSIYFRDNNIIKYSFGSILILYGAFRGVNSYFRTRKKPEDSH